MLRKVDKIFFCACGNRWIPFEIDQRWSFVITGKCECESSGTCLRELTIENIPDSLGRILLGMYEGFVSVI